MKTFTAVWSTDLEKEIKEKCTSNFPMKLVGEDAETLTKIWNQGIDSYLEAFIQSSATWEGNRLVINIDSKEMHILIRRLLESEEKNAADLASVICSYFNIELI